MGSSTSRAIHLLQLIKDYAVGFIWPLSDLFGRSRTGQRVLLAATEIAQASMGLGNYDEALNRTGERRLVSSLNATLGPLTVVDIGAHHGLWSLAVLAQSPDNRVLAVEPDPQAFAALSGNLGDSSRAHLLNAGISNDDAVGTLHIDPTNSQVSTLLPGLLQRTPATLGLDQESSVPVSVVRFDSLLKNALKIGFISQLNEVNFIKIDTEGFEFDILKQVLTTQGASVPVIQFEFNSHALAQGQLIDDFAKLLGARYHLFRLAPRRLIPRKDLSFSAANAAGFSNWVAVDQDLASRIQDRYQSN